MNSVLHFLRYYSLISPLRDLSRPASIEGSSVTSVMLVRPPQMRPRPSPPSRPAPRGPAPILMIREKTSIQKKLNPQPRYRGNRSTTGQRRRRQLVTNGTDGWRTFAEYGVIATDEKVDKGLRGPIKQGIASQLMWAAAGFGVIGIAASTTSKKQEGDLSERPRLRENPLFPVQYFLLRDAVSRGGRTAGAPRVATTLVLVPTEPLSFGRFSTTFGCKSKINIVRLMPHTQ